MKSIPSNRAVKNPLIRFLIGIILLSVTSTSLTAWKVITHIHLTLVCREDALDDGKLVIYEADYENGRILRDAQGQPVEIGWYAVHPTILRAIRQYPDYLRAGAVGTDILPDIITAQAIVHPDNSDIGRTISDDWLSLIWTEAVKNRSSKAIALAAGYLAHGAGDLFGHTFVNHYAGGPFEKGRNAIKHIVLESYIDNRTPKNAPDFFRISIKNIEDFLYRNLVVHPMIWGKPDTIAQALLINASPPRIFLALREFLSEKEISNLNTLYQMEDNYNRRIGVLLAEAAGCTFSNPLRSMALMSQATALETEWLALKSYYLAKIAYITAWIKDIERGLRAWPDFGRQIAEHILFCAEPDREAAQGAAEDFMYTYGLSMCGLPDAVGETLAFNKEMWEMLPEFIRDLIDLFKSDLLLFLLEKAWGLTWDYIKNPEVHFDFIMNNAPGTRTTLREFNRDILKINDTGYSTEETYDWMNIPAMVNTVTMTKLAWLSEAGLRQLLQDLEERGYTSNTAAPLIEVERGAPPAILGYIQSLDHSNQWCEGQRLLFVRDPCVYRKLFLKQTGENVPGCLGDCDTPPDGSVTEAPIEFPLAPGFSDLDMAVDKRGVVWQWGKMYRFTNAGGKAVHHEFPVPTQKTGIIDIAQMAVGRHNFDSAFALSRDGTVWAWGSHAHPQSGLWHTKNSMEAHRVPNLKSIVQLAAGTYHYLALRSNGQVWAWGGNSQGQIGWGKRRTPARPRRIPVLGNVKFIAAGDFFSFAVTMDGSLWAWGSNNFGQLGDGTREKKSTPVRILGLTGVKMVAAGYGHALVLKEDGTVWAWGQNSKGEIGDGTKIFRPQPTQVQGLNDIISVSAESFHSAALRKDGTVWVWGYHHLNQIGPSGRPKYSELPIQVKGLPPVVAIACGEGHILTLDKDGFVWTWGLNAPVPEKIAGFNLF